MAPSSAAAAALAAVSAAAAGTPPYQPVNFYGCRTALARSLPYCDESLPYEARAAWLVANLTLDEKIATIGPNGTLGDSCAGHTAAVDRLGLPGWSWLTETNTAVAGACIRESVCPTTFPGPLGMAASFNRSLWQAKGRVMGLETRALANAGWHRGSLTDFVTLTGFGPNINILRDPRFGRSSELPGEDPFLSGTYAQYMVRGMQTPDAAGRPLMLAYLKHFTAYSRETDRGQDNYNISLRDLHETYLAQYEIAFKLGGASGVMCSYNGINGHPSCANDYILNKVMRSDWKQPGAVVVTDCGAVSNLRKPPIRAPSDAAAAAFALMNGTDIELGSTLFLTQLATAVRNGLATDARITEAVHRWVDQHMAAGRFDAQGPSNPYASIGIDQLNSTENQRVNADAGVQALVLLKNAAVKPGLRPLLPLAPGLHVAVVGPQGVTTGGLLSDYAGNDRNANTCMNAAGEPTYDCMTTIADAIARENLGGQTTAAQGVEVSSDRTDGVAAALAAAAASDVVVLVLGIDKSIEHEGVDRTETTLPGLQHAFALQVLALGKPVVLVLTNGGQLEVADLISASPAVVEAFNPSVAGPRGLALSLFGRSNSWGKLPYTIYDAGFTKAMPMDHYSMSEGLGRTYRYYTGRPTFPFGFGLSYTTFALKCVRTDQAVVSARCEVKNVGTVAGDAVILVFHSAGADVRRAAGQPLPLRQLRAFDRRHVPAGQSVQVDFSEEDLGDESLKLVDPGGQRVLYPGTHGLLFSTGQTTDPSGALDAESIITVQVPQQDVQVVV